jgi:hypothetical protein
VFYLLASVACPFYPELRHDACTECIRSTYETRWSKPDLPGWCGIDQRLHVVYVGSTKDVLVVVIVPEIYNVESLIICDTLARLQHHKNKMDVILVFEREM